MVDVSVVSFDPAYFGPTSQLTPDAPRQFPSGSHTRPFWGGGFRAGATYRIGDGLTAGASYTSPQWFETWKFNAREADGDPITFSTQFSLPAIISVGLAYEAMERFLLCADVRYFEYQSSQLLGERVVDGGAGWQNIWAAAIGGRYQLSARMSAQLGYLFNENPVPANLALFNTQLPALTKHTASLGIHLQINESIGLSLAYVHGFKNTITGSVSQLIGTSTTLDTEYDSFVFGLHIKFGAPSCAEVCMTEPMPAAPEVPEAAAGRATAIR
jgi:long-chain fatty acid transport protein